MVALMKNLQVFSCLIVIDLCAFSQGELFTAISDVEPLLETHKRIIEDLEDYITKEEDRLAILKRYVKIYIREHQKAMDDIPNYLGNPLNVFTLVKRMTTDLKFIRNSIDLGIEHSKDIAVTNYADTKYPTLEDLTGAVQALSRLQKTYHLAVDDLAEGRLNGVIYRDDVIPDSDISKMSAGDCYELGRILYNNEKDFTNALAWMMAALRKFNEENNVYSFKEIDILEYISSSHISLENVNDALKWSKKIIELDPNHSRALENTAHFQKIITKKEERKLRLYGDTGEKIDEQKKQSKPLDEYAELKKIYRALCRGEKELPSEITKQLTCRYLTENHPFLRLAPIKMEYKYLNPDIVLFHEVLSNEEIEHIKGLAKPRFRRATVKNPKTGVQELANYRISKSAWLGDEESPIMGRVSRRVADITGLDMGTAEQLQVVNYGIGGHYDPHFDFVREQESVFPEHIGNRIATVLFYMSDVIQGGATVFTELGLSLFPVRGAAAVWLNLHPSGKGNPATSVYQVDSPGRPGVYKTMRAGVPEGRTNKASGTARI